MPRRIYSILDDSLSAFDQVMQSVLAPSPYAKVAPRKRGQTFSVEITSYAGTPSDQKKEIVAKLRELADKLEAEPDPKEAEKHEEPVAPVVRVDRWTV